MRVCIVARASPVHGIGGMQDHTSDLARGLVRAGHDVEVIASRHPHGLRDERQDGVRWHFVDAPNDFTDPTWLRESWREFGRLHGEIHFDVVHGEGSSALGLVRQGVHRHVPLVVMFHGNFLGLTKAAVRRAFVARRAQAAWREARGLAALARRHFARGNWYRFRACEAIVPSRQQLRDTCLSHALMPSRVHVVPNGIDAQVFRPRAQDELRAKLGLAPGPLFVTVGRLNHQKGTHHAVRALACLDGAGAEALLAIVGDGPERGRLEGLVRELGLERRVVFAGVQPRDAVAEYLAAADAFLFPTQREEAAPLVLPQAMASGLPVIASRIGGIPEVIDSEGENGLLIAPGDVAELASMMRKLLDDAILRQRLREAARRRVLAEYTIERMTERTAEVYRVAAASLADWR